MDFEESPEEAEADLREEADMLAPATDPVPDGDTSEDLSDGGEADSGESDGEGSDG